ncbi:MAG: hypothetical protein Q8O89_07255 [Nanoarchaeota archaeon]|nr:hypothetical protein [Nanoarchaeota archaeon]
MHFLKPVLQKLEINGNLSYSDSAHAWMTIRLKKRLFDDFPQLKEKEHVLYKMLFYRDYKEFLEAAREIDQKKEAIPIMLWFFR